MFPPGGCGSSCSTCGKGSGSSDCRGCSGSSGCGCRGGVGISDVVCGMHPFHRKNSYVQARIVAILACSFVFCTRGMYPFLRVVTKN